MVEVIYGSRRRFYCIVHIKYEVERTMSLTTKPASAQSLSDIYFEIKAGLRVGRRLCEYKELLSSVDISHPELSQYIVLNRKKYNRSVVIRDGMLEMDVITWMSGQESDVHGHPGDCIYKMLKGSLREDLYNQKSIIRRNIVEGDCGYICDSIGYHNVKNNGGTYAVSLHVYSPSFPIDD